MKTNLLLAIVILFCCAYPSCSYGFTDPAILEKHHASKLRELIIDKLQNRPEGKSFLELGLISKFVIEYIVSNLAANSLDENAALAALSVLESDDVTRLTNLNKDRVAMLVTINSDEVLQIQHRDSSLQVLFQLMTGIQTVSILREKKGLEESNSVVITLLDPNSPIAHKLPKKNFVISNQVQKNSD